MSDCTCKYCTQDRRDDAIRQLRAERDELRARVAELEGEKWEAIHSGGHWWIAEEKTGDLIEMVAGPENEIAEAIAAAHNFTLAKKEANHG
jgi:hypothetical protein